MNLNDWDIIESKYYHLSDGANAYSRLYSAYPSTCSSLPIKKAPVRIDILKEEKKRIRIEKQKENARIKLMISEYRQKERMISRKRRKEACAVIIGIIIVSVMFAFVLYRQAQITAMNFMNNSTQRQIHVMRQDTAQLREAMVAGADLNYVYEVATERLGMQEPGSYQIVSVSLPESDKLVTGQTHNTYLLSPNALEQARLNMAEYYLELE